MAETNASRERFEKILNKYRKKIGPSIAKYGDSILYGDEFMLAAAEIERDTRERCAQIVEEEARNWNYSDINPANEAADLFAENVAERIRGVNR